jgi:hypothetical protein
MKNDDRKTDRADITMHDFDPDRRKFLVTVGRAGLAVAGSLIVPLPRALKAQTQAPPQEADYTIRIAPVSHEIAPGKVIKTTAYNGSIRDQRCGSKRASR